MRISDWSSDVCSSDLSGAINLATKQAFQRDYNAASLSLGTDEQRRATADFNQAFGNGNAFRINLMAQDSGVPGRDEVTNKRWGVAPSLAFGLDGPTRLFFNLLHVYQTTVPHTLERPWCREGGCRNV